MARCRIDFTGLLLAVLFIAPVHAAVPSPALRNPAPVVRPELADGNDRQEAAEERAEIAFRVMKENALHRYTSALKKCGELELPPQTQCAERAHSLYKKSIDEADAAFEESHARALMLGTTVQ